MTNETFLVGATYRRQGSPEILVYMGYNWSGNGYWHQFRKVDGFTVWCEVKDSDLHNFSRLTTASRLSRAIGVLRKMAERDPLAGWELQELAPAELEALALGVQPVKREPPKPATGQDKKVYDGIAASYIASVQGLKPAPEMPSFQEVWKKEYEPQGYRYGADALELVHMGYLIALRKMKERK